MKKENKKKAQERRAVQRKKHARRSRVKRIVSIAVPVIVILILIGLIIVDAVKQSKSDESDTEAPVDIEDEADDFIVKESIDPSLITDTNVAVANGDVVNIDYVGYIDGVEFDGGNTYGMGTELEIGSGGYIDDFEEQLIGHYIGETVEVTASFPENYGVDELNGKEAVFDVVINGIYE